MMFERIVEICVVLVGVAVIIGLSVMIGECSHVQTQTTAPIFGR